MANLTVLAALLITVSVVDAHKILCLFPHVAKSHFVMAESILKGLAARGHEVTMVSHFPQASPIPNYKDISLVGSMPEFVSQLPLNDVATGYVHTTISLLAYLGYVNCENTLEFPAFKQLMAANEKYDLVITELFNTDCLLGYVHKLQIPNVALSTSILMPWAHERFGNPDNPSYMGNHFLYHGYKMTFVERLINTVYQEGLKIVYKYMFEKPAYELSKKYFGENLPALSDIARNTSLLLVNSHFSLNQPRPFLPNIIEVGGVHLQPPTNKLPKDLKDFLDGAKHGVIYFSLGSSVRVNSAPKEKTEAFLQAFSELPQRVIWKWESDTMPGKSDNIKIVKWLPQMDVLAHPNVKVFIMHAGLMGTLEAATNGVPMIAMPLFGDQFHNAKCIESEGISITLNYHTLSKSTVLAAIKTILNTPSFSENAKRVQKAFNDRPMTPLDTAIYWIEYVIRHEGAHHLHSAALDLAWYQYLLLDVAAVLCAGVLLIIAVMYLILKKLFSLCRSSKPVPQKSKSKAKKS